MQRPARARGPLDRAVRSRSVRALVLLIMVPILIVGAFGGTTLLAHEHHGHGVHWHAAPSRDAAIRLAAEHVALHDAGLDHGEHGHPCPGSPREGPDEPLGPGDSDEGVLITIPDSGPLAGRSGSDLAAVEAVGTMVEGFGPGALAEYGACRDASRCGPAAWVSCCPRHLCALRASMRLVRTSHALLI